jgi:hypothetical protein
MGKAAAISFPFLHQVIGPVSEFRADTASLPVIFQLCKVDCFTAGFTYYTSSFVSRFNELNTASG